MQLCASEFHGESKFPGTWKDPGHSRRQEGRRKGRQRAVDQPALRSHGAENPGGRTARGRPTAAAGRESCPLEIHAYASASWCRRRRRPVDQSDAPFKPEAICLSSGMWTSTLLPVAAALLARRQLIRTAPSSDRYTKPSTRARSFQPTCDIAVLFLSVIVSACTIGSSGRRLPGQ